MKFLTIFTLVLVASKAATCCRTCKTSVSNAPRRYSMIGYSIHSYCGHKYGNLFACIHDDVSSRELCESHCTSLDSCIGYDYQFGDFWGKNGNCRVFPTEKCCPPGFRPKGGDLSESMLPASSINDLKEMATEDYSNIFKGCYGKV